ncbi:MAG: hypothetical protein GY847_07900 [Proteobacteria bacterium]|nr:hypothetical protein [Pseudomonadota bacterium]
MTIQKKTLSAGIVLGIAFWAVFAVMFSPVFNGENAFRASDKLFNAISKGSTHYIPKLVKEAVKYDGKTVELMLEMEDETMATEAEKMLTKAGVETSLFGSRVEFKGDLGKVFKTVLKDSDDMFYNRGEEIKGRYGIEERRALFVWWNILKNTAKDLKKKGSKEDFAMAKFTDELKARGVEVGYNYYGIQPESVSSKAGILTGALVFYVIYTLWWGFAIFFISEGLGLKLSRGNKKEV